MKDVQADQERNGAMFDRAILLETRRRTRQAMHRVAAAIHPGMIEEDAMALMRQTLKQAGMLRGWHGIHVRFGHNTLRNFGEPSEPGIVLREDDIFFIDIGPVWQGHEGDAGDSFVVGNDPEMHRAVRDVRTIFDATRTHWREAGASGAELYRHARTLAEDMGWTLNLDMSGHRLSDFPHAVKHRGALIEAGYAPSPDHWVLEIQIRHPTRPFSAFHEDLLLECQDSASLP